MAAKAELLLEKILQEPGTGGVARQSRTSLVDSEVEQVGILMEQMKRAYPGQEIAEDTVEMWAPAWLAMAEKYGIAALRGALQSLMLHSRFFPHPSELREALEAQRPIRPNVTVPTTRAEVASLCGAEVAANHSEMSIDEVRRLYGDESAKLYGAKLQTEVARGVSRAM